MTSEPEFVPHADYVEYPPDEMQRRAARFAADVSRRRTVREFSDRPVPDGVIEDCLRAAGSAPSGAILQPWHFVIVTDPSVERWIREAAEADERDFYHGEAPQEWLDAPAPHPHQQHGHDRHIAARGARLSASDRRCIPPRGVADPLGPPD